MIQSVSAGTPLYRRRRGIQVTSSAAAAGITRYRDAVLTDSPISYWRLAEPSGTAAADVQGVNNGTYQGAVTLGAASAISDTGDAALSLPGASTAYLLAKSSKLLSGLTNWTVEYWVKRNGVTVTSAASVYCERAATGNDILKLIIGNTAGLGSLISLVYRDDAGTLNTVNGATQITDNIFHHCVVTKSATAIAIYRDGIADGAGGTLTATNTFTDASDVRVGADPVTVSESQAMIVDEVAVYNTALSSGRVAAHYAAR